MFAGTYTALITPFRKGRIDDGAYQKLVRDQVRGGVDGIVPVGTTGESPSLGFDEHIWVIELAVQAAKGKIKVLAGTGANSTAEAIHLTRAAEAAGVDGSLQVAPYYNKPSQEGVFQHFRKNSEVDQVADYPLQHPCSLQHRHRSVNRAAPGQGVQKHRRHQGGRRRCRPCEPASRRAWSRVHHLEWRRRADAAVHGRRRRGRHQCRLEHHPETDHEDGQRLHRRQCRRRPQAASKILPDVQGLVHRDKSRADEGRPRHAGQVHGGIPPAALQNVGEQSRSTGQNAQGLRRA